MARRIAPFIAGIAVGLGLSSGLALAGPGRALPLMVQLADQALAHTWYLSQTVAQVRHPELRAQLEQGLADLDGDLRLLRTAAADDARDDRRDRRDRRPAPPPLPVQVPLDAILHAMDGESFSDGKLAMVRDVAPTRTFTCDEVTRILQRFTFDGDRVEAAVVLYPRVVDPDRWFAVYGAFTFSSSRDEVRRRVQPLAAPVR